MDKFDRDVQRKLLLALYEATPGYISEDMNDDIQSKFGDTMNYAANVMYLAGHGLIEASPSPTPEGLLRVDTVKMKITSKGIDFIRDDGGLSAILNVQTVKLHRETVVVLEDLIAISNLSESDKEKAKSKLLELPAEAVKAMVGTLITAGFSALLGK